MTQVKDLHSLSSITSELNYVKSIFHLFIKMPHFNHRSMKNKNFSLEIKYLWKICLHYDWYVMEKIRKVGDPCNYIISSPMVADSLWNVNQCYGAKKKKQRTWGMGNFKWKSVFLVSHSEHSNTLEQIWRIITFANKRCKIQTSSKTWLFLCNEKRICYPHIIHFLNYITGSYFYNILYKYILYKNLLWMNSEA